MKPKANNPDSINRRDFLKKGAAFFSVGAATMAALSPLGNLKDLPSLESFLQRHFIELSPQQKQQVLQRLSAEIEKKYGVTPTIGDPQATPGVEFAYALNLGTCIGCRKCVHACVKENNQSRNPGIQYIRVLKLKKGSLNLNNAEHYYDSKNVPEEGYYYMPVQCQQCANPPCVKVCPVKATWQEKDGIVAIDYNWCIGCRYCETACPYWARRFNFSEPTLAKEDINPNMAYLANIPRHKGVVEKCHFCLHRTRQGKFPACVEVCPAGSRKFGNLLDPNSEVAQILKQKRVYILKEELATLPRFFYYFDV